MKSYRYDICQMLNPFLKKEYWYQYGLSVYTGTSMVFLYLAHF